MLKNVGINVVNLYRDDSDPYLYINIVGREHECGSREVLAKYVD